MEKTVFKLGLLVLLISCVWMKPMDQNAQDADDDGVFQMNVEDDGDEYYDDEVDVIKEENDYPANQEQDIPSDAVTDINQANENEDPSTANQEEVAAESNDQREVVNDDPVPAQRNDFPTPEQEVDWGHPVLETNDLAVDIVDQVPQEEAKESVQNSDTEKVADQGVTTEQYGVVDPETVMHGGDEHDHGSKNVHNNEEEEEEEPCPGCLEDQEKSMRGFEERQKAETEELELLQPKIPINVHDTQARKAAEFMKNRQFGPVDIEEIIHGGHHVHGEDSANQGKIQAGNIFDAGFGGGSEEKAKKADSTIDPEEMMHAGQGHGHDHQNPHNTGDGARDDKPKGDIGVNVEKIAHGDDYVYGGHDDTSGTPKNKVTYQDILDLGLSEELLKGIDLSQLLEQEKREYDNYKYETGGDNEAGDTPEWEKRATDLRQQYLAKLYAKVRVIEPPDLEHAEWDNGDDEVRGRGDPSDVLTGGKQIEHEMEMWGSTAAKGHRKPIRVVQDRRVAEGETTENVEIKGEY